MSRTKARVRRAMNSMKASFSWTYTACGHTVSWHGIFQYDSPRGSQCAVSPAFAAVVLLAGSAIPAFAQVSAYEGARLIVGDGRAGRERHAGRGRRQARAGGRRRRRARTLGREARRSQGQDGDADDRRHARPPEHYARRAPARPESAGLLGRERRPEHGHDGYEVLGVHNEVIPEPARYFSAGAACTTPEPGRTTAPYWITSATEGRKAVDELAAHQSDIVKIWSTRGKASYKKLTPEIYGA